MLRGASGSILAFQSLSKKAAGRRPHNQLQVSNMGLWLNLTNQIICLHLGSIGRLCLVSEWPWHSCGSSGYVVVSWPGTWCKQKIPVRQPFLRQGSFVQISYPPQTGIICLSTPRAAHCAIPRKRHYVAPLPPPTRRAATRPCNGPPFP